MSVIISNEGLSNDEALFHSDPRNRMAARAVAAEWIEGFAAWVNAELNRPDACRVDLLQVMAVLQIQTHAAIAAQLLRPGKEDILVEGYKALIDKHYATHVARVRRELP